MLDWASAEANEITTPNIINIQSLYLLSGRSGYWNAHPTSWKDWQHFVLWRRKPEISALNTHQNRITLVLLLIFKVSNYPVLERLLASRHSLCVLLSHYLLYVSDVHQLDDFMLLGGARSGAGALKAQVTERDRELCERRETKTPKKTIQIEQTCNKVLSRVFSGGRLPCTELHREEERWGSAQLKTTSPLD